MGRNKESYLNFYRNNRLDEIEGKRKWIRQYIKNLSELVEREKIDFSEILHTAISIERNAQDGMSVQREIATFDLVKEVYDAPEDENK